MINIKLFVNDNNIHLDLNLVLYKKNILTNLYVNI